MRIKMPCIEQQISHSCNSNESNGIWSNRRSEISFSLLQKFWSELSVQSRKKLLKVDKQTLFEQARKNMYCSRCNGLLLEFYIQIVAHGKSMPQLGAGTGSPINQRDSDCLSNPTQDDMRDPALRPWGGLTATRDGWLTLLDCYLCSKSLKALQNVFDSARARERERELLYPDACGGGSRGWISQGVGSYGRGHGTRETCALHTARLSCDTLVDFWSALGDETQHSLLRMKEEDFVERLMYRFDSKRFCRDCRKNVIREFKELKELKRSRRDPRCTSWFCVADTAFQYEVSDDMIQVDWGERFGDSLGMYSHFEWAVGTGEGKSDILEFENVGMNRSVCVDGLDLCGLNACFITLRAWRVDGRCTELSVKAHALRGLHCVHSCLVVGDGYVSITSRESIRSFFEHAEDAEDEEDDESMERDGSDFDGEFSRPQKHAKSPELAREFLLDAATVIFKEQIEKAFREGTARQNAHITFISLSLQLLEERLHVACKEIITLEKQMKLIEEEEREKREEEERKERRKVKEKEKKQRRKERLREKERDKEKCSSETVLNSSVCDVNQEESIPSVEDHNINALSCRDIAIETVISSRPASPNTQSEQPAGEYFISNEQSDSDASNNVKDGFDSSTAEDLNYTARIQKHQRDVQGDPNSNWSDQRRISIVSENGFTATRQELMYYHDKCETLSSAINRSNRQARSIGTKSSVGNSCINYSEKIHCSNNRSGRYDDQSCSCNRNNEHRAEARKYSAVATCSREVKSFNKSESALDMSKQFYRGYNHSQTGYMYENHGRTKGRSISGNATKDLHHLKKVWEPLEPQRKYPRSNTGSDVTITAASKTDGMEVDVVDSSNTSSSEVSGNSDDSNCEDKDLKGSRNTSLEKSTYFQNRCQEVNGICQVKESLENLIEGDAIKTSSLITAHRSSTSSSSSENCLSCHSDGDSNTFSSNHKNTETSSTSDSEDAHQLEERQETSICIQNGFSKCHNDETDKNQIKKGEQSFGVRTSCGLSQNGVVSVLPVHPSAHPANKYDSAKASGGIACQPQGVFPQVPNPFMSFTMFQAPSATGYYHQSQVSWPVAPAAGFLQLPHPDQYLYTGAHGFGLNGNSNFHMQPLQDIATPLPYPAPPPPPPPVYQAVSRSNRRAPEDKHEPCNPGGVQKQSNGPKAEELVAAGLHSIETPSRKEDDIKSSDKKHDDKEGFSLFHFGCHVPLSIANKSGHVLSRDEIIGKFSARFPCCHSEANKPCNKKETEGEQYNLFAPRNGIEFSLF